MLRQVPNIKCQCLRTTTAEDESTAQEGVDVDYVPLRLLMKQGKVWVGTEMVPEWAHMNFKAALVLSEALKYTGVQLDISAERNHLEERLRKTGDSTASNHLLVDAHISGRRSDSENIGKLLSKHGIYLQDPHNTVTHLEYHNPHVLSVDVSEIEIWFQENELCRSQTKDDTEWTVALDSLSQQHNFDATAVSLDKTIVITHMMP